MMELVEFFIWLILGGFLALPVIAGVLIGALCLYGLVAIIFKLFH